MSKMCKIKIRGINWNFNIKFEIKDLCEIRISINYNLSITDLQVVFHFGNLEFPLKFHLEHDDEIYVFLVVPIIKYLSIYITMQR